MPEIIAASGLKRSMSSKEGDEDSQSPPGSSTVASSASKKRRKVNHACVYCRRSHMTCDEVRPCTRCCKRSIGHLCHDEPRDSGKKAPKSEGEGELKSENNTTSPEAASSSTKRDSSGDPQANGLSKSADQIPLQQPAPSASVSLPPPPKPAAGRGSAVVQRGGMNPNSQQGRRGRDQQRGNNYLGFANWDFSSQNRRSQEDSYANPYHSQWMFNAPEVSSEFNLLSDFLGNLYNDDSVFDPSSPLFDDPSFSNQLAPPGNAAVGNSIPRPQSAIPTERARENYYLTAADPNRDVPTERMAAVLAAKADAGLLRPFNYVKGYARLSQYMETHITPQSRKRILAQLDNFRPKFRERTQTLTDLDLVHVEEWFEKSLLEYDRVFASMAVPACLWRRTGEIFRGNKEFAEMINVPIGELRDGKLAIYELVVEDSAVSYWEKFGTIAFDTSQKAMLTTCHLKNPDQDANEKDKLIQCCFSFTIRRDIYDIPSLIIGNFMPVFPKKGQTPP